MFRGCNNFVLTSRFIIRSLEMESCRPCINESCKYSLKTLYMQNLTLYHFTSSELLTSQTREFLIEPEINFGVRHLDQPVDFVIVNNYSKYCNILKQIKLRDGTSICINYYLFLIKMYQKVAVFMRLLNTGPTNYLHNIISMLNRWVCDKFNNIIRHLGDGRA